MTLPEPVIKTTLPEKFMGSSLAFIGRLSFESRCTSAFSQLASCHFVYKHFFKSVWETEEASRIGDDLGIADHESSRIDTSDPLQARLAIATQLSRVADLPLDTDLVVDITTFRREELLILLNEMQKLPHQILARASFLYSVAETMGKWLSNSVRQVRPVVGYPGDIMSSQSTHLVILAGIEHHRALAAIETYEPSDISLGMVPEDNSVSAEIYERNLKLRDFIVRHFDNVTLEFDFSAKDPASVVRALDQIVKERPNHNTVIAPLNTKVSTLACGAYALRNPKVQLCYAEVDIYNTTQYSVSSNEVLIIAYHDLFKGFADMQ